jgi:GNAT superfamily N-acetyltransferase
MRSSRPARIRLARPADLPDLARVELEASSRFDGERMTADLAKRTLPLTTLRQAQTDALLWVASAEHEALVGFLAAERLDDALHITEMSVVPSHGRRGVGAGLLAAVCARALHTGRGGVTLTTFAAVPWNAPFYAKNGFRLLASADIGPGLARRMDDERAMGLIDRVAMWHPGIGAARHSAP